MHYAATAASPVLASLPGPGTTRDADSRPAPRLLPMQGRLQITHYSSLLNSSAEKAVQEGDEHRRIEVLMMNTAIAYHRSRALSRPRILC